MDDEKLIEAMAQAVSHMLPFSQGHLANMMRAALAVVRREEGWRPIETAPKDGAPILVWADGYEWPETVRFELYDTDDAEEVGEPGYWRFADTLLADVTDSAGEEDWTHWRPLPPPPEKEPSL